MQEMQRSAEGTLAGQAAVVFCVVFLISWAPLKVLEKMFDLILADQREREIEQAQASDYDWTTLEDHPPPGMAREAKRTNSRRASKVSDTNSAGPSRTATLGDSEEPRSELLNRQPRWSQSPDQIGNEQSKGTKDPTSPGQTLPGARSGLSKISRFQSLHSMSSQDGQRLLERTPSGERLKHGCGSLSLASMPFSQESSASATSMNGRLFERTPGPKVKKISSGTRFLVRNLGAESLRIGSAISSPKRREQNPNNTFQQVPLLRGSRSTSALVTTPGPTHFFTFLTTGPINNDSAYSALLKTQCEVSGADYSLFWHQDVDDLGWLVVGGSYVSDALLAEDTTITFAEASLDVVLKVSGDRCDKIVKVEVSFCRSLRSLCLGSFCRSVLNRYRSLRSKSWRGIKIVERQIRQNSQNRQ
jgi:hypothetical protein